MKLTVDKEANAVYLQLADAAFKEMRKIAPNLNYDYSTDGRVIGIEVLQARTWFGELDGLTEDEVISRVLMVQNPPELAA